MRKIILLLFISMSISVYSQDKSDLYTEFKQKLIENGIEYPDIVLHQARLETGNFTSRAFTKLNNCFGFQMVAGELIQFSTIEDCIEYYAWWQRSHYKGGDYYAFLDSIGYAIDPEYIKKLKEF
jgi:flagellum-specific peptidoglycan hydrolase FlgJ